MFAIAVATSSMNEARRASVSGGKGYSRPQAVTIWPYNATLDDDRVADRRADARLMDVLGKLPVTWA